MNSIVRSAIIAAVIGGAAFALTACGSAVAGPETPAATQPKTSSVAPAATTSPSAPKPAQASKPKPAAPAPASTPVLTSAPPPVAAVPVPVGAVFTCGTSKLTDLHAVWALPTETICSVTLTGDEYDDAQKQAVATAYGADHALTSLKSLYSVCATTDPAKYPMTILSSSDSLVKEVTGALMLCPDHPNAAAIKANVDNAAAQEVKKDNGGWAYTGKHLVGTDIQPGTWQSVGDKVEDCYWETSDAEGNIIDNNFISIAPRFTIDISADAAGFTNSGCVFERVG